MKHLGNLRAALALAAAALAATPALALQNPDLKTTLAANVTTVPANGNLTFTVTVANVGAFRTVCTFDPDTRRRICEPVGDSGPASGVTVDVNLPAGMTLSSAVSADSGLVCTQLSAALVRCFNGFINAEDSARITVPVKAPNAGGTFTVSATADPGNAIAERSEANNSASVAVTVQPPPNPNLPDLNAYVRPLVSQTDGKSPIDFNVVINNSGPVAATNINLEVYVPIKSMVGTPTFLPLGTTSNCTMIPSADNTHWAGARCSGMSIPAWGYITMQVRAIPFYPPVIPSGTLFTIYGYLDPLSTTQELNENNNLFNGGVMVIHP